MRETIRFFIGISISILLLFWVFHDLNYSDLHTSLQNFNVWYMLLIFPVILVVLYLRAFRWALLIRPHRHERTVNLFSAMMITNLGNNILPARIGELLRIFILERKHAYSKVYLVATMFVEKISDLCILLLLFVFESLRYDFFPIWLKETAFVLGGALASMLLAAYLMLYNKKLLDLILKCIQYIPSKNWQTRLSQALQNFEHGLHILKQKNLLFFTLSLTLCIWLVESIYLFIIIKSLNIPLDFLPVIFVTILMSFGTVIPSAPGFIGTFQAACVLGLYIFGIAKEDAVSFSIISHVFLIFSTSVLGVMCLFREGIAFRSLFSIHRKIEKDRTCN